MNQKEFEYLVNLYRDLEFISEHLKRDPIEEFIKAQVRLETISRTLRRKLIKGLKNES